MRLAIVGSRRFQGDTQAEDWAARLIQWILTRYRDEIEVVISGGAIGIDQLAATLAAFEDLEVVEFLPDVPPREAGRSARWNAYKARDKLIAEDCTHLVCISHHKSSTYGAGWTADYAEKIGRKVKRYSWNGQL